MKPHLRTLPVKLDPHEVAQRADELARELHDQAVAEEAAQSTKKKIAKDGSCHEEHSALDGTARTIRDDTQEVVDTRPLTQEELREARQEALPGFRVGSSAKEWTVEPGDVARMEEGRAARKARAAKKTEGT